MNEPDEVIGNDDLRFDLRYKNAEMAEHNAEQAKKRATRLEAAGAFRVLEKPTTGFKRRAGQQNWSEELHTVREAKYGRVEDTEGKSYPMSIVKPVSSTTEAIAASTFARGGSTKVTERRQIAFRPWLAALIGHIRRAGDDGLSIHKAGKFMATQQGFTQALREQRATLSQMIALYPESIKVERQRGHAMLFVQQDVPMPRAGTLDAFAV